MSTQSIENVPNETQLAQLADMVAERLLARLSGVLAIKSSPASYMTVSEYCAWKNETLSPEKKLSENAVRKAIARGEIPIRPRKAGQKKLYINVALMQRQATEAKY